ncbi:15364_t:CDS:1, partial [Funneliformis caledonium]
MGDRSSPLELSDVKLCQEAVEADTSVLKVAEISEVMDENDE